MDAPERRQPSRIHYNHYNCYESDETREKVKTKQYKTEDESGNKTNSYQEKCVFHHGQILLVENVIQAETKIRKNINSKATHSSSSFVCILIRVVPFARVFFFYCG